MNGNSVKFVAGAIISRWGLHFITLIVLTGVGASYFLTERAITAVMTMIGAVIMALIQMLQGITGTSEKPEIEVIHSLIEKLNALATEPLYVSIEGNKVTIRRGTFVHLTSEEPGLIEPLAEKQ